ncbi:MAG: hypothetical protein WD740_02235 [Anaerolineales bacterium]
MKLKTMTRPKLEAGQSMVEYVLIIVVVALFLVVIFTLLSDSMFNVVNENLLPAI